MKYDITVGLEVHVQLATEAKLFCSCSTAFGNPSNANTCPVCLGMPGVLPVLNKKAVEYAIMSALAFNCSINETSTFDRKNYFYPDLPKGYQISQFYRPIAENGYIEPGDDHKKVRINRIHIEEDAGKLLHEQGSLNDRSLVDLNRSGMPLIEIVTEPDIQSPLQARMFLEELKSVLRYTGVSDCNMEEGSLRCDANISLKKKGAEALGVKAEIKNMNSFKAVEKGLEFEVQRQTEILDSGGKVVQETRRWDEDGERTVSMRSKEEAHDYRYFPEPNLGPLEVSSKWIERLKDELPELPGARRERIKKEYELPEYDARFLTESRNLADYFEEAAEKYEDPKEVSNWIMGDMMRLLNEEELEIDESPVSADELTELLRLVKKGEISGKIAKNVFEKMFKSGKTAGEIVSEEGLTQIKDEDRLTEMVDNVIEENPDVVDDIRGGKDKAVGFLVGQIMKKTQGRANPQMINRLIRSRINE